MKLYNQKNIYTNLSKYFKIMLNSILDNDLYKFSMQNAVIKKFPCSKVRYKFINRGEQKFPAHFAEVLKEKVAEMEKLRLTKEEKQYLKKTCYYLDPTYIDFLNGYSFDTSELDIKQKDGDLSIEIEGYWYRTILWEVPLMAIISELYFELVNEVPYPKEKAEDIVKQKALYYKLKKIRVADFGTRRRYSFKNHDMVVEQLKKYGQELFIGTSNVYFAKKYDLIPIGTHAHEWFMFHAAKYGYKMANPLALQHWVDVYGGWLGIALSDTFTSEVFFRSFDSKFAKLFDGVRHDSGDALEFTMKTIAHYEKLGIDPISKVIVFSDALSPEKVERIEDFCRNKIKTSYGIGTNFTNDVGVKPLNIVIKIQETKSFDLEWVPTIKLSDEPGKHTGRDDSIKLCKEVLCIK